MPGWASFEAFLNEAQQTSSDSRQALVDQLLYERTTWPWITDTGATFVFSRSGTTTAALNLDTIKADPPFAAMTPLEGTSLWYVTRTFASDDLLDYVLAINDPMTPLAQETDIAGRVSRHWQVDPLNPVKMQTAAINVSVLQMPQARPFPDWSTMSNVAHGAVDEHQVGSRQLNFSGRKLWVYTPPNYAENSSTEFPLLVLHDGQWCTGPLQIPFIADALIKHKRMQPIVIAMIASGTPDERAREFISSDRHYLFVLTELLPYVQSRYRIDPTNLGLGGVAEGAVAAAHTALKNPEGFAHLMLISPPLGRGRFEERLTQYSRRFEQADSLPRRIFQAVGRYETASRFLKPGRELRDVLQSRRDVDYRYVEHGSGHGLVGFKGILPEALAWAFAGEAAV
jgi:enterochelin esterase-like enzyme